MSSLIQGCATDAVQLFSKTYICINTKWNVNKVESIPHYSNIYIFSDASIARVLVRSVYLIYENNIISHSQQARQTF